MSPLRLFAAAAGSAALLLAFSAGEVRSQAALSPLAREVLDRARTKVVVLKTSRQRSTGSGTGFLARPNLVVTAAHVVTGTTRVTVWLNGVSYPARVLESHPEHDLAVLRLRAPALSLKPVELAAGSANLATAEELLILAGPSQGPAANGEPLHRVPILAAFSRRLVLTDPTGRSSEMLSMRAGVRKGDSGSPVLRVRDGRVVGVLSSRQAPGEDGASHFAYAVPVEAVHTWLDGAVRREAESEFYLLRLR